MAEAAPVVRELGLVDYEPVFERMRRFSETRAAHTRDELWLLQHRPVFTQGRSGRVEHLLDPGDIAIVQTDRGGQVTYHGPGQWVVYLLVDLGRRRLGVRDLVDLMEAAVIELLGEYGIEGHVRPRAPGVYVAGEKIAALGLRIHRGCSYHGLALNVDMDLEPFARINPCGYEGLAVTSMARLKPSEPPDTEAVGQRLLAILSRRLMTSGHA